MATKNYTNVASATTTAVKSGAGTLHSITVNKAVASGVITVYDNTAGSGTKIATITNPATLLHSQSWKSLPWILVHSKSSRTGMLPSNLC